MNPLAVLLLAQLAATARPTLPVLAFPEPGIDDTAAYRGYRTRFFHDAAGNTVQIYVDDRGGRVVHLLADAEDASIGFTARAPRGAAATLRWDGAGATVARTGRTRTLEYRLAADVPALTVGWFLLGSMRVERDFQYDKRHTAPFGPAFVVPEVGRLLAALPRLAPAEQRRQLALLGAPNLATLRARARPLVTTRSGAGAWTLRVVQPSLDGRDTLTLELQVDPRRVVATRAADSVTLRARTGGRVPLVVRIATTGPTLTPLARDEIFTADFLRFLADAHRGVDTTAHGTDAASLRARWMERQVRGVELLVSHEKLMAGLPAYATYFGRDMLVTALMMRGIWRDAMSEAAIASALRRLSPRGEVSHEEALGGQAVRESAAEYAAVVDAHVAAAARGDRPAADSLLARARAVLRDLRRTRENYHMIDDEFQLPVLAARWLADSTVPAERKRAFLLDTSDGGETRLARLLRELGLVARMTAAYAAEPTAANLVSFPRREQPPGWSSASWRDSRVGYAEGRYAMDVNAVWVPHALESVGRILAALPALGLRVDSLAGAVPELAAGAPLGRYARDPQALRAAVDAWSGASRHFLVQLGPAEVRAHVAERLAAMPADERRYWNDVLARTGADRDSLAFLAVALDGDGRPIGVANSDPATRLFLGDREGDAAAPDDAAAARVLRDVRLFVRAYPAGLFIDRMGPVVANDAYAPPAVWAAFDRDRYHGPRVAWGREVNLFLLGTAQRIAAAGDTTRAAALAPYVRELRDAVTRVQSAVAASGFRSELWSYEIQNDRLVPVRYGTGSDVQLWSTTDLAVQFALSRLGR